MSNGKIRNLRGDADGVEARRVSEGRANTSVTISIRQSFRAPGTSPRSRVGLPERGSQRTVRTEAVRGMRAMRARRSARRRARRRLSLGFS
jgi:hypothetical protein